MNDFPSISIVTCTYNANLPLFEEVLKTLRSQEYPKKLVEHIIMDAGSTNGTIELAKKYDCKVFVRADLAEEEQMRASLGFKKAKGKIILIIQSDNIVMGEDWLKRMVEPFIENRMRRTRVHGRTCSELLFGEECDCAARTVTESCYRYRPEAT